MASAAVLEDRRYRSDRLIICFGGHPLRPGVFELRRPLMPHPADKIFLKDLNRVFFLTGVDGISRDIPETCDFLADYVADGGYAKVLTLGLSAGSHAAVLFGTLLNVDRVIGIGPRTLITGPMIMSYPGIDALMASGAFDARYDDLAAVLDAAGGRAPETHLFYSTADENDVTHARRLAGHANVTLHGAALGGHLAAILTMTQGGRLDPRIAELVDL